jgi:hypothetical protein
MKKKFRITIPYFCYLTYEVEAETEEKAKEKIKSLTEEDSDIIPVSFEMGSRFGKVQLKAIPDESAMDSRKEKEE